MNVDQVWSAIYSAADVDLRLWMGAPGREQKLRAMIYELLPKEGPSTWAELAALVPSIIPGPPGLVAEIQHQFSLAGEKPRRTNPRDDRWEMPEWHAMWDALRTAAPQFVDVHEGEIRDRLSRARGIFFFQGGKPPLPKRGKAYSKPEMATLRSMVRDHPEGFRLLDASKAMEAVLRGSVDPTALSQAFSVYGGGRELLPSEQARHEQIEAWNFVHHYDPSKVWTPEEVQGGIDRFVKRLAHYHESLPPLSEAWIYDKSSSPEKVWAFLQKTSIDESVKKNLMEWHGVKGLRGSHQAARATWEKLQKLGPNALKREQSRSEKEAAAKDVERDRTYLLGWKQIFTYLEEMREKGYQPTLANLTRVLQSVGAKAQRYHRGAIVIDNVPGGEGWRYFGPEGDADHSFERLYLWARDVAALPLETADDPTQYHRLTRSDSWTGFSPERFAAVWGETHAPGPRLSVAVDAERARLESELKDLREREARLSAGAVSGPGFTKRVDQRLKAYQRQIAAMEKRLAGREEKKDRVGAGTFARASSREEYLTKLRQVSPEQPERWYQMQADVHYDRKVRIPVPAGYAESELAIRKPEIDEFDEDDVRAVLQAFDGRALVFSPDQTETIARGLTTLSNMTDDLSREPAVGQEERTRNRYASLGLTKLVEKLRPHRTNPAAKMGPVFDRLAALSWDVGDQNQQGGFVVLLDGKGYLIEIEGWGPECVDACEVNEKTLRKLEKAAALWVRDRAPNEGRVVEGKDEAVLVSFSGFPLKPEEIGPASESRDEEATIRL